MRAIVRFSLNSDPGPGKITSKLNTVLKRNHLVRRPGRTGTYEGAGDEVNIDSLRRLLSEFFDKLKEQETAKVDHFWMYVDQEPAPTPKEHGRGKRPVKK